MKIETLINAVTSIRAKLCLKPPYKDRAISTILLIWSFIRTMITEDSLMSWI